jgi:hypothetical protein
MAWAAYTQVVISIQSPSTLNQMSMINDSLDGHEAFTKGLYIWVTRLGLVFYN